MHLECGEAGEEDLILTDRIPDLVFLSEKPYALALFSFMRRCCLTLFATKVDLITFFAGEWVGAMSSGLYQTGCAGEFFLSLNYAAGIT